MAGDARLDRLTINWSGPVFQSFDSTSRPDQGPPRLAALRAAMMSEGLDGFLVPRADAHQGEYVATATSGWPG